MRNTTTSHFINRSAARSAGVVVPPEDLGLGEFYDRTRPFDHMLETDNGGGGVIRGNCFDVSSAVPDQPGFLGEDQDQSAFGCANIERLKVRVQNQDRRRQDRSSRTQNSFQG